MARRKAPDRRAHARRVEHIVIECVTPELDAGRYPVKRIVGDTVWVASTASGTLSRIDAHRPAVVATVRVGVRPYAVAADRQGAWVAVLGQPVMHASPGGSTSQQPAWLLRLCGVG